MELALCSLPFAGKSTLFSALAGRRAEAGRDSKQAILAVPDERLDWLCRQYNPKKRVPAQITVFDPAPPAGGPGNDPSAKLPPQLRQAQGLIEVVRNFDAGLGPPHPAADHQALAQELLLSDLITVEQRLERLAGDRQRGRKVDGEEKRLLEKALEHLNKEIPLRLLPGVVGHVKMKGFGLVTAKPLLVVANNAEDDEALPPGLGGGATVVRASLEAELAELDEHGRKEFMVDLGIAQSALDRLITAAYDALELITFFTVGQDECRAWTIPEGSLAPQAAGAIHTDMEKGFIRAEVMRLEDLMVHGSEAAVKKAGLMKLKGKDYRVKDGDIFHVRFNV